MDVSLTLENKHKGKPIDIIILNTSIQEESSLDVKYEKIILDNDNENEEELSKELESLYQEDIRIEIYAAWHDF